VLTVKKEKIGDRPTVVLAHANEAFALRTCAAFRRMGWDAYCADSGPEARRLARLLTPNLVILDAQLPDESGWLTCDKLTREMPRLKVVVVGSQPRSRNENFASFVGATAHVDRLDGLLSILSEVANQSVAFAS